MDGVPVNDGAVGEGRNGRYIICVVLLHDGGFYLLPVLGMQDPDLH
jgi:hypothetical protein